jgi:hypothetical protein
LDTDRAENRPDWQRHGRWSQRRGKFMSDSAKDILLDDPLSGETRAKRKFLLVTSLIGIAMVRAEIVPKKLSALGVDLEPSNQGALLYLVSVVIIYFLFAFVVYAFSDFVGWRKRVSLFYEENTRAFFKRISRRDNDDYDYDSKFAEYIKKAEKRVHFWKKLTPIASIIRGLFDFLLPMLVSVYAVYILVSLANQKI